MIDRTPVGDFLRLLAAAVQMTGVKYLGACHEKAPENEKGLLVLISFCVQQVVAGL